jgi:lambda family phage tail tape measure protein
MAFNQDAAFRISAKVEGQSGVDQLRKSLETMSGSVNGLTGKFTGLMGAFKGLAIAVGAFKLLEAIGGVIELGAQMQHLSERTGVTVETLSTFRAAGKMVGLDIESIAKSFGKFDVAASKAMTGNKETAAAFKTLGISIADLKSLAPDELILRTADAFAHMENGPTKARIAVDLFGKAGYEMIPMLNMGREAIEKLGVKMSSEFAERAAIFERSMVQLQTRFKMFTASALTDLMPTLQEITTAFLDVANTKPDMVGFMDTVGEGMRLLAVGVMGVYQSLKILIVAAVDAYRAREEFLKYQDDMAASLNIFSSQKARDAARQSAAEHLAAAKKLTLDIIETYKRGEEEYEKFSKQLLKNSLIYGEGTAEEIKRRQREETKPPEMPKGAMPDMAGLDVEKVDKYTTAMRAMGEEAAKLKFQAEHIATFGERITTAKVAQMAFETSQGQFADESAARKAALMREAAAVDEWSQSLRRAQAALQYDNATKKIQAEADATDQGTLAKAKAAAMQDLENAGIEKGTDLYERLADARIKALTAQVRAQETQKRDEFVDQMDAQTAATRLGLAAVGMSSVEYRKHAEALKIDAQVQSATRNMTEEGAAAFRDAAEAVKAQRLELIDLEEEQKGSFTIGSKKAMQEYAESLADVAKSTHDAVSRAFQGMEDALVNFVKTGKLDFKSLADSIISDMIRIAVQQMILRPMMATMGFAFADGGVMTGTGPLPLKAYATGGVARSPQVAVFGEGSMPEAFVPLPDGRRIPVAMQGAQTGNTQTIHQTISIDARGADAGVEARIELAARRGAQEGYQMVMRDLNRGGLAARLTGRA